MKRFQFKPHRTTFLAERYPLPFVLILLLVWTLPAMAFGSRIDGSLRFTLLHQAVMGGLAALLLTWMGWWQEAGFNGPSRWRDLRVMILPLLAILPIFRGVGTVTGGELALYGLMALLLAFEQEAWYRGIILRTLLPAYGCRRATAISALLFGAVRAVYLFSYAPGVTLVKALVAGLCGFILAAVRVRTRSIWPGLLITFLFYLSFFLARGLPDTASMFPLAAEQLVLEGVMALGIFLLARAWMKKMPAEEEVVEVKAG